MVDKFIVDAGPFIHLEQIGRLNLLNRLSRVSLPESVFSEITRGSCNIHFQSIRLWNNTEIVSVKAHPNTQKVSETEKYSLQKGETDCISWALQHNPCVFLTDDLAARTAAKKLSIETHGTVGIILHAAKHRWLRRAEAERSLELLYHRSSLFITYDIIANAIRALRKAIQS